MSSTPLVAPAVLDAIKTLSDFSERSRDRYADTKQETEIDGVSCRTMRVPVSLLNRIRELATAVGVED